MVSLSFMGILDLGDVMVRKTIKEKRAKNIEKGLKTF